MMRNNQSQPGYPNPTTTAPKGTVRIAWGAVIAFVLAYWFRPQIIQRLGNPVIWNVIAIAIIVIGIMAIVACCKKTSICGLFTSCRARSAPWTPVSMPQSIRMPVMHQQPEMLVPEMLQPEMAEGSAVVGGMTLHYTAPKGAMWFKKVDGELYLEVPKKPEDAPEGKILNPLTNDWEDKPAPMPPAVQDLGAL